MSNNLKEDEEFQKSLKREEELSNYIAMGKKREIHLYHPGTEHIYRKITNSIENIFSQEIKRLLDVGCGFGDFLTLTNLGKELYGLELSQERVNITQDRLKVKNARIDKGIAEKLPYPDNFFDLVLMQSTLHHCMYKDIVLQEAGRVLNKTGKFVLIEGADDEWYRKTVHYFFEKFSRKYEASQFEHCSKEALEELLNRNGFEITVKKDISIPFAWVGRIGKGDREIWKYLSMADKCIPNIFPWYHLFVCKKNERTK